MAPRSLVVKVTAGKDDPERCNQAFTVAATAVASGISTSLWLTGESSWFAVPGRAEEFALPHAPPLADLLTAVLAAGTVTLTTRERAAMTGTLARCQCPPGRPAWLRMERYVGYTIGDTT